MSYFAGRRCVVTAGEGTVARFPAVVCVATAASASAEVLLSELFELCGEVSGAEPGIDLAHRLAAWLGRCGPAAEDLAFGTISEADAQRVAVFLLGQVQVIVPSLNIVVSGTDAATWTDRLLTPFDSPMLLTAATGAPGPSSGDYAHRIHDLRAGIVPGSGLTLVTEETADRIPHLADLSTSPNPATDDLPALSEKLGTSPSQSDQVCRRPAVPPDSPTSTGSPVLVSSRPERVVSQSTPSADPGVVMFPDGATYTLDKSYLIGRDPSSDQRTQDGTLCPIALADMTGEISRVHLEIKVDGGRTFLVDSGSSNGTLLASRGQAWELISPHHPTPVGCGDRVRIGDIEFSFPSTST